MVEEAVAWLQEHYDEFEFWQNGTLVWTVQTRLRKMIGDRHLPYHLFNDYRLPPGARRVHADLIIRDARGIILAAAEFKFEPSHRRAEYLAPSGKLPVVVWGSDGVAKDVTRIRDFVEQGGVRTALPYSWMKGAITSPAAASRDRMARPAAHTPGRSRSLSLVGSLAPETRRSSSVT